MSIFERLQGGGLFLLFAGLCLAIGRSAIEESRAAIASPAAVPVEQVPVEQVPVEQINDLNEPEVNDPDLNDLDLNDRDRVSPAHDLEDRIDSVEEKQARTDRPPVAGNLNASH